MLPDQAPRKQIRQWDRPWTLALAFLLAMTAPCETAWAEPVIVVNANNSLPLDEAIVARIFLRQVKTFPDGSVAVPVNQKDGELSEQFRTKVLKKSNSQFKAYWAQQLFTGGAKPLNELEGDDAVLKYVADTPGGIGYVESGKARAGVRVVGQ